MSLAQGVILASVVVSALVSFAVGLIVRANRKMMAALIDLLTLVEAEVRATAHVIGAQIDDWKEPPHGVSMDGQDGSRGSEAEAR